MSLCIIALIPIPVQFVSTRLKADFVGYVPPYEVFFDSSKLYRL
jgi:hypothetical protein